jgi:hypothetical protein
MAVPNIFGTATSAIPLSQLDQNFATAITLGNTAVYLGNTTTSLGNVTLTNVTISSGNVTLTGANVSGTANVSTLVVTGNQSFVGTGNRITGNFSNATIANRVMFQNSVVNDGTLIGIISNGTGTASSLDVFGVSDPTNATVMRIRQSGTESQVQASITGTGTYHPMTFYTGGSERVRIDTSGNVGIGTSSPLAVAGQTILEVSNATGRGNFYTNTGAADGVDVTVGSFSFVGGASTNNSRCAAIVSTTEGATANNRGGTLLFNTKPNGGNLAERARIDSSGNLLVGTTNTSLTAGVGAKFIASATEPYISYVTNTAGAGSNYHLYNTNATNNGYRFYVTTNGGIANFSANNINLSDERTKTDIQNAGSYLAKICAIPVRTFKYKDQADDLLNLGVIAQEVESIAPELVDVLGFGETPEDGIPLKSIYQTDLQYALMKCIQEQQALITALTARITALEQA